MTPVVDEVVDSASSVDNQRKVIGKRLKQARAALKMTQKKLVSESGIPLPSLRDYEGGKRMPGGDAVASLVNVGINANWLLTGHGPMLWDDALEFAKQMRGDQHQLTEAQERIVLHAMGRVKKSWFVMSPSEPGNELTEVVDDYNQGNIFLGDQVRDEISTVTIEDLIRWGRALIRKREHVVAEPQVVEYTPSLSSGYVAIPLYNDVRASAGYGAVNGIERADDALMFKEDWIKFELGARPQDLCLIRVHGDSMEPTLRAGDVILVDHSACRPDREGIYILRMGEMLIVKRLQAVPGGQVRVISDNPAFDSRVLKLADIGVDVDIVGRVVWSGRRL